MINPKINLESDISERYFLKKLSFCIINKINVCTTKTE